MTNGRRSVWCGRVLYVGFAILAAVVLAVVVNAVFYDLRSESRFVIQVRSLSEMKGRYSQNIARAEIVAEELSLVRPSMLGLVRISIRPDVGPGPLDEERLARLQKFEAPQTAVLNLTHYPTQPRSTISRGGSKESIPLTRRGGGIGVLGEGKLAWEVVRVRSVFWYPFDAYKLDGNPEITATYRDFGSTPVYEAVESFTVELHVPTLVMRSRELQCKDQDRCDWYEIILERPRILRAVVMVVCLMGLMGVGYMTMQNDIVALTWQTLGFVGVLWGVRGILLTGVTAFPIGIDYVILNFYLLVGMLLIFKIVRRYASQKETGQEE